jgi:methyltransferase (TIGR00027 family)
MRLDELGLGVADHLHLVPVDFEAEGDWWQALHHAGFDPSARALVSSSGVSMYISKQATATTLERLAAMATGSIVAMTFMLPIELVDEHEQAGLRGAAQGAAASGTPWISFFTPDEIAALAVQAGFARVETVSTAEIADRLLAGRADGLHASGGEAVLLART